MATEQTDTVVRAVAVIGVLRSTVPRSVEMALLTAPMDASFVDVSVSLTVTLLTLNVRILDQEQIYKITFTKYLKIFSYDVHSIITTATTTTTTCPKMCLILQQQQQQQRQQQQHNSLICRVPSLAKHAEALPSFFLNYTLY